MLQSTGAGEASNAPGPSSAQQDEVSELPSLPPKVTPWCHRQDVQIFANCHCETCTMPHSCLCRAGLAVSGTPCKGLGLSQVPSGSAQGSPQRFVKRTDSQIQRAYDAAVGPPHKKDAAEGPPSAPPAPPPAASLPRPASPSLPSPPPTGIPFRTLCTAGKRLIPAICV